MNALAPNNFLNSNFNSEHIDRFIILGEIANRMLAVGLSREFVAAVIRLSFRYEGAYDLVILWSTEGDPLLKEEIIADLQDEIDAFSHTVVSKKHDKKDYLQFDNLEAIAKDVMAFKKNLKIAIERWGGISKLSKETGIPQPSLSRFLTSASMPRRTTLEKIARAMNLKESALLAPWI